MVYSERRVRLYLVFKKVWYILLVFLTANTTFTTVAGNKLSAAGKTIDREKAVVGTALAARHGRFETKLVDLVDREHRAFLSGIMISGNECGTKRTHDTGDIRTYGFAAGNALKASQVPHRYRKYHLEQRLFHQDLLDPSA